MINYNFANDYAAGFSYSMEGYPPTKGHLARNKYSNYYNKYCEGRCEGWKEYQLTKLLTQEK